MDNKRMMEYYNYFSTQEFEKDYLYEGNDLGAVWSKEVTWFRIWAPTASSVMLHLFESGNDDNDFESIMMDRDVQGTWVTAVYRDLNGIYYTYAVTVDNETKEAVDPYARAVGINGNRGMVIDLATTDPEGFTSEKKPIFIHPTDAIIYEIHVRDFSVSHASGMVNKGKYLAFTESKTKNSSGDFTGLEHLKELGITHIHLLPAFDYATVDETRVEEEQFNWGYDPKNYNVPEGFYSTDPSRGEVRIREFKQMVYTLHQNGIRVVMDVVYNHTMEAAESNFNRIVPGYYYRLTSDGYFSNASGCGNETASERAMMRKFMIDSVVYWAKEYHIDGFRFDLMGVHDIRTMNEIKEALNQVDPSILMYGEGWAGGLSPLPEWERAVKYNMKKLNTQIAAFSDNLRDGIKGSVFSIWERGFVNGKEGMEETIKFGVVASTQHSQVNYARVNYSNEAWAVEPTQTINYASAHDNLTLWDKLTLSNRDDKCEDRIKMNLLSAAILFTCQGIPFFQAGEEFLRSKPRDAAGSSFEENSYKSPDVVNSLKWDKKTDHLEVYRYYKGLIAFRKAHKALRMTTTDEIQTNLRFLEDLPPNVVAFEINTTHELSAEQGNDRKIISVDGANKEEKPIETICVIYNANRESKNLFISQGEWRAYIKGGKAGTEVLEIITGEEVSIESISTLVMIK